MRQKVIKRRADELASPAFMLEEFMYEVVSNTPEGSGFSLAVRMS